MFTLSQLQQAQDIVGSVMPPTPCYRWPLLCEALGVEVWMKHENHTPTGAFKVRGGLVFMAEAAAADALPERFITATRGNHGQSIPFAASRHGVPVSVLVPAGNSVEKNAAMRAWGAQVEEVGTDFDQAREEAQRRASAGAAELVPSFHEHLVRGVATYALELFAQAPRLDRVYVPIGMGSGIAGVIGARDALGLTTEVIGVVAAGADAMALSLEAGRVVETNQAKTFADGLACRVPSPAAFEVIRKGAERVVRVSEEAIADAVRLVYRATHNVLEGAGAAACAAAAQEAEQLRGKQVAVIATGGNIDADWFCQLLAGKSPQLT